MLDNLKKYQVILASQSPRRKELLNQMGIDFKIRISNFDESSVPESTPKDTAELIAKGKANALKDNQQSNELVIAADTIVVLNNKVIGKPSNAEDAQAMLQQLSGTFHHVITSVCLQTISTLNVFSTTTKVNFSALTTDEIMYYIENFSPFDKAGAYGIQEWLGVIAVHSIEGSYHNVMGLPTQDLYEHLKSF